MTKEQIIQLINTNPKACERALVVLFNRQTSDEQTMDETKHHNQQGFCPYDAHKGSYYAKLVIRGLHLNDKALAWCRQISPNGRHRLGKYWRQLNEAIEEKNARKVAA